MSEASELRPRMEVLSSLQFAVDRAQRLCFRPFSLGMWLLLSLIAFLDELIHGGLSTYTQVGTNLLSNFASPLAGPFLSTTSPEDALVNFGVWYQEHIVVIYAVLVSVALIGGVIGLFLYWLAARGQMMFILGVGRGDTDIEAQWTYTRSAAWELFKFRVGLAAVVFPVYLVLMLWPIVMIMWNWSKRPTELGQILEDAFPAIIVALLLIMAVYLLNMLVVSLTRSFVSPIMLRKGVSSLAAWREFIRLCSGNLAPFALFLLIFLVVNVVFSGCRFLTFCCCYIGLIPVFGQALLLPFYVFERAYTLYVLQSLGPEYQLILED